RFVDWEGTRYRLDFKAAEATRLAKYMGERPRPYLSSAHALVDAADALEKPGLTREALGREAGVADRVEQGGPWFETDEGDTARAAKRFRDLSGALDRAARDGDIRGAPRLAPMLRDSADDFMARGLLELAYAAALGQPDRAAIAASDAASRHEFGLRPTGGKRSGAWRTPIEGAHGVRSWHVTGSLVGLGVRLAEFGLVPLSGRPPLRRPTRTEEARRVFTQAAVLIDPAALDDEASAKIVEAVRRGRARLAAARTPADLIALADEIRLGPT